MFSPVPVAMEAFEAVLQRINAVTMKMPPPMMEVGRRLRLIYERQRSENYQLLSRSEWRQLPYSIWLDGLPSLMRTDSVLVDRYWNEVLPAALNDGPRRARRWLMPLFFVYCEAFVLDDPEFKVFALKLQQALDLATGPMAEKLRAMSGSLKFFEPEHAPECLSYLLFVECGIATQMLMAENLLWPGFPATRLGGAIFSAALNFPEEKLRQSTTVMRLLEWLKYFPASVVKTDLRVLFANALLRPWWPHRKVDVAVKKALVDFFLREYGDPRGIRQRHYQWDGVDQYALTVIKHWLTGETLRGFVNILERTADETWNFRKKFWMAYYDQGFIEEAWLVLGRVAQEEARVLFTQDPSMRYGRLERGAEPEQSVLLMRIGDLIFTEWSHNGSLRAYKEGDIIAPGFYHPSYDGYQLKAGLSLDFHDGLNMRPALGHRHSELGTWQRKARDMIHRHTGVYLSDWQIV